MKSSYNNVIILLIILFVVGFLYRRYEDKIMRQDNKNINSAIQKYLLDDVTLAKSKKPILWIHVPYEYNSRNWLSFGSRSSLELNQPYLHLTMRSIIQQCDKDFTICIIDDEAFSKLIPGWSVNMTTISDPILSNMRTLGLMKLLYIYGGMVCPLSFLCINNLLGLYQKGIRGEKMFICEFVNRNITSTEFDFSPSLKFCGAPKECEMVSELCDFIQRMMSRDSTAQIEFLGDFDRWCTKRVKNGKINQINGFDIGVKTIEEKPVILDDLMSNHYLPIYTNTYGIYIPADEILTRRKYEWFARMSQKQVMESDTIIGNYILITLGTGGGNILEPLEPQTNREIESKFVGFWKTPNYPGLYGLKPNFLGDNLSKAPYTGR